MKHMVTDLNDTNELIMFSKSILSNFCFDTFFNELDVDFSPIMNSYKTPSLHLGCWAPLYISR